MGIVVNCVVDRSANIKSTCSFEVINASSDDITNYSRNADVTILCFEGVIFSGKVTEVEKYQKNEYAATTPFYNLKVKCQGDYSKLESLIIERDKRGYYVDKTSGELIEIILPDDWEGDIQTTGNNFSFTVTDGSCASNINDIVDQTQYDWRCRRDYERFESNLVNYVSASSAVIVTYLTSETGSNLYKDRYAYFISGDQSYVAYGKVRSDSDYTTGERIIFFDVSEQSGMYDGSLLISSGDKFVVLGEPVFDYAGDLSTDDPVQTFLLNTDIFLSADTESSTGNTTQVVVSGLDPYGTKRNSILTACYVQDGDSWDRCSYTTFREDGYLSDQITIGTTNTTIEVLGHTFKPTTGDTFVLKSANADNLYYYTYDYVSHTETVNSSGVEVTEVVVSPSSSYDQNRTFPVGSYVLHKRIIVEDTSQFFTTNVLAIGNEGFLLQSKGTVTIDTVSYNYIFVNRSGSISIDDIQFEEGYSHQIGTFVRNCEDFNRDSPQSNSPLALYGTNTYTMNVSGNANRGALDKYATNYLTGNSRIKSIGKGRVILKDFWKSDEDHTEAGPVPITVGDTIRIYSTNSDYIDYQLLSYRANMTSRYVELTLGEINKNWLDAISMNSKSITRTI